MMDKERPCQICGNPIIFRYVDGKCTPIHTEAGCFWGESGGDVEDYSGYREDKESQCFRTNCPECGEMVFFVRHNGGCVWIDPPLGPPWYKHPCFDTHISGGRGKLIEASSFRRTYEMPEYGGILGVVTSSRVDALKGHTDVTFSYGGRDLANIRLKNNAGYLAGKLCVFDVFNDLVVTISDEKRFLVIRRHDAAEASLVKCPFCMDELSPKNYYKHLRKVHISKMDS